MVLPDYKAELELANLPDPELPSGGVVVKVLGAGVCHSDLHLIDGEPAMIPRFPWVLGHEATGEVVAIAGSAPGEVTVGDRVAVFGGWGCGRCSVCLGGQEQLCNVGGWVGIGVPGAYAEYLAVPAVRHLLPLNGLDPVQAAPLTDAGLTPYRAVRKVLPLLRPGSTVLSIGAGGLGQYGLRYLKLLSPAHVIVVDTAPDKLQEAHALGADALVDPVEGDPARVIDELTSGAGAAAVLDFVGSQDTLALAAGAVSRQGVIVVVGLGGGSLPFSFLGMRTEASVTSSYWGSRNELADVLQLARDGKLAAAATTYPLELAGRALDDLRNGRIATRAVLTPS
jgi:propanol-preferring alcohol dehydrogenase